jgi:acyl carrier protein
VDTTNIRRFISDELMSHVGSRSITDDTPLWEGIIDSIGLVELVGFLQKEYGIHINDGDVTAENFRTVAAIERLVTEKSDGRMSRGGG